MGKDVQSRFPHCRRSYGVVFFHAKYIRFLPSIMPFSFVAYVDSIIPTTLEKS